jgi:hypothetical protein
MRSVHLLQEVENEHELIKRQMELSEIQPALESFFYTHGKAAMMSAKFYHECLVLGIPCVLDVHTQFGQVDAIIELDNCYYIIEFKSHKAYIHHAGTHEQVDRYAQHSYPVILIYDSKMFSNLLLELKAEKAEKGIYLFADNKMVKY